MPPLSLQSSKALEKRSLLDLFLMLFVPKWRHVWKKAPRVMVMGDKWQTDLSYLVGFLSHELVPVLIC